MHAFSSLVDVSSKVQRENNEFELCALLQILHRTDRSFSLLKVTQQMNTDIFLDHFSQPVAGVNEAAAAPAPVPVPAAAAAAESPEKPKLKPNKRFCSVPGCKNGVVQGGLCVSHGAKRRKCQFPGCEKNSKCAGLCSKHG